MEFQIPTVTTDDLFAFHAQHFPHAPAIGRSLPVYEHEISEEYYEEDDGLGYYPDGTKCTLSEADIAYLRRHEIKAILRKRKQQREIGELSEVGEAQDSPGENAKRVSAGDGLHAQSTSTSASLDRVQSGRVEKPKTQQWATTSARTKAKNKRNRNKYKAKKRDERLKRERAQREGRVEDEEDEESDEWDPWHQANGPDVQQDKPLDLDY